MPPVEILELTTSTGTVVGEARLDASRVPPRVYVSRRPDTPAAAVAEAVLRSLGDHRAITRDGEVAAALVSAGAELVRHSSRMTLRLAGSSQDRGAHLVEPLGPRADPYVEVYMRAYPPEHPDHEPGDADPVTAAATLQEYLDGTGPLGPLLHSTSGCVRSVDGAVVGVVIVTDLPDDDHDLGGPWITEVFVDPAARRTGVARSLLQHASAALRDEGRASLGLAVTQGSPARRLYDDLGFQEDFQSWALTIPPAPIRADAIGHHVTRKTSRRNEPRAGQRRD